MSVMDCLVVIFRHIYCHSSPRDNIDELANPNELLTFALSDFGADTPEGLKLEREARERMFEAILKEWKLEEGDNLADLFENEKMLKTIWAHDPFRICHSILHRLFDAEDWAILPDEK